VFSAIRNQVQNKIRGENEARRKFYLFRKFFFSPICPYLKRTPKKNEFLKKSAKQKSKAKKSLKKVHEIAPEKTHSCPEKSTPQNKTKSTLMRKYITRRFTHTLMHERIPIVPTTL